MDIDPEEFVYKVLSKLPKLNSVDARVVMQDLYETEYGIYDHVGSGSIRPLSSVAMFPSEDINTNSRLEEAMRMYLKKDIKESYGLSLVEFMDLPVDIIEMMIHVVDEHRASEHRAKQSQLPDLDKLFKEK